MNVSSSSGWDATAAGYSNMPIQGPLYVPCVKMLEVMNKARPFSTASTILDVGSGPGTVASLLFENYGQDIPQTARMIATDFSQGMVEAMQARKARESQSADTTVAGCWARLELDVMDAQQLDKVNEGAVSHLVGSLVYFMLPDYNKGLAEAHRVLQADGIFACTSWSEVGWMDFLVRAAHAVKPSQTPTTIQWPANWKPWQSTDGIKTVMEQAGFRNVHSEYIPVEWHMPDPKSAVAGMAIRTNPATSDIFKSFSEEEMERCREEWIKLVEANGNVCRGVAVLGIGRK